MTAQPEPTAFDSASPAEDLIAGYAPVATVPRSDGWAIERQKIFLTALTETGCVSDAATAADISPRSAYRLRARPEAAAFADAWDAALHIASHRLVSLAWERAVYGATEEVWSEGRRVAERRKPSDRLLIFLLRNLDPLKFGAEAARSRDWRHDADGWYARSSSGLVDQPFPAHTPEWDNPPARRADLDEMG